MTYETAEQIITQNPEAAKRFYDLEFLDHSRTLREIQSFDTKKELNPFWNIFNDLKTDCLNKSKECQNIIQDNWRIQAKKRVKAFKENPELIKARLSLKSDYLEAWPDYDKFVRWSGLDISKSTFKSIMVEGDYSKTLQNLYKLIK